MNIKNFVYFYAPYIIGLVLFCIPFFWLGLEEINLGGDSSRLYFYDPQLYLLSQSLYNVVSSGIGGNAVSYFSLPYIFVLLLLKNIGFTPTQIISIENGVSLSIAFLSVYFIIQDLIKNSGYKYNNLINGISSVFSGLFYIFSPYLMGGWDRAILTHNQLFLNPLMFFFLLRYFISENNKYLLCALVVSVIFSSNFSYIAAPPFFAFYPLAVLFLVIYKKYVLKKNVPKKGIILAILLFFLLHMFHLVPTILNSFIFSQDGADAVFSDKSKFSRGLDYFKGIAPNIKVSFSWMNLSQMKKINLLEYGFIAFPSLIIISLLISRVRVYYYTFIFFMIAFFFATANITNLGFSFYTLLFNIPGFSMFRNFFGQWGFIFVFFYSILFGQALYIVLLRIKFKFRLLIVLYIFLILVINAWPFINGSLINSSLFSSKKIKPVIQMDPYYKNVIDYIYKLPTDGKILTLPLVGPGYHVVSGKNYGMYIGPSTFSYLAGKNDYTGYEGLYPFGEYFLKFIESKNYTSLKKLFSILNIKYVFYNSDEKIYNNDLEALYSYVKKFVPKNQNLYKKFIEQLSLEKNNNFGKNYYIYNIKNKNYLPHIFITSENIYTNNPIEVSLSELNYYYNSAIFSLDNFQNSNGTIIIEAKNNNPFFDLIDNYHLHTHNPFVSRSPNSSLYLFTIIKERYELNKARKNDILFLDLSLFTLAKRVNELEKYGNEMTILQSKWIEPKIWEIFKWKDFGNSWESNIQRYETGMNEIIQWVISSNNSDKTKYVNKVKIYEQLHKHNIIIKNIINQSTKSEKEKKYLKSYVNQLFNYFFNTLNLEKYNPFISEYSLNILNNQFGEYEFYVEKYDKNNDSLLEPYLNVNNKVLKINNNNNSKFIEFPRTNINQNNLKIMLYIPYKNLIKDDIWETSGVMEKKLNEISLTINNTQENNFEGLGKKIPEWKPNSQYYISFDYKTNNDEFKFILFDKNFNGIKNKFENGNLFLERSISSLNWKNFQAIVSSDYNSQEAYIKLINASEKRESKIFIKNLAVYEIKYPKIYLKKVNNKVVKNITPKVTFSKINPTKYVLKISNINSAFTLVFLESFNKEWKLINPSKNSNFFESQALRIISSFASKLVGFFTSEKYNKKKIVLNYFNGNLSETNHSNTFLNSNTFETWGKEAIAQNKHFKVYGYANAWIINPEDLSDGAEHTLVLEHGSQKYFYIFLFISLVSLIFIIIYCLKKFIRNYGKNN